MTTGQCEAPYTPSGFKTPCPPQRRNAGHAMNSTTLLGIPLPLVLFESCWWWFVLSWCPVRLFLSVHGTCGPLTSCHVESCSANYFFSESAAGYACCFCPSPTTTQQIYIGLCHWWMLSHLPMQCFPQVENLLEFTHTHTHTHSALLIWRNNNNNLSVLFFTPCLIVKKTGF